MAGTLIDTITKHRFNFGPANPGGSRMILLSGVITLKNGTDGRGLDISADIPNLLGIVMNPNAGYVFDYDYANKVFVIYGQTDSAAKDPLAAVTAKDLGALTINYIAWGF